MAFQGLPVWAVAMLGVACAGVLAILHLLRIRRPQLRVITTLFWSLAVEAAPARSFWHRFRHPGTYALLLAIAVLLVLALGQPEFAGRRTPTTSEVIVLDAGMSMSSPLPARGGTRLDAGRTAVLDEVLHCAADDPVAVLVLDPLPRVLLGFDEPRCVLAARLSAVTCAATPAARAAGVSLATALLQDRPRPQVVVVTDRDIADAERASHTYGVGTRSVMIGEPQDNAAILGAVFQPVESNPLRGQLLVGVGYWGSAPAEKRLLIEHEGGSLRDEIVQLIPGTTQTVAIEDLLADGREIRMRLADSDAIAADNIARFRLPRRSTIAVATLGSPPDALRALLTSDPTVRLVGPDDPHDVMLVCEGFEAPPAATMRIHADGPEVPATLGIVVVGGVPLTAGLSLQNASLAGPGLPAPRDTERVLLTVRDVPLATLETNDGVPRVNLAAALFAPQSNATRQPDLVILLTRALRHLAGWDDERVSMPAERVQDDARGWFAAGGGAAVQVLPGSRLASNVSQPVPALASQAAARARARWTPAPFEWLLLTALLLLVVEAVLHTRGRIV